MGVKFLREYEDIISELTELLLQISDIYTFLDMPESTWKHLSKTKKGEYIKTLADDLFFALGNEHEFEIGSGKIVHDTNQFTLEVFEATELLGCISLS